MRRHEASSSGERKRRVGERALVAVEGAAVELGHLGLHLGVGHDDVLLRLHVAAGRRLLGGAQAGEDLVVGHRLVGEAADGPRRHEGFEGVHGVHPVPS